MTAAPSPADLVRGYVAAHLPALPDGHGVGSLLGSWLLYAMAAGDPAEHAAARDLLAHPHPQVGLAAALWTAPQAATAALDWWARELAGAGVAVGPVPSQAEADRWAAAATDGLVPRFPLTLDAATELVLANALATRISWQYPFSLTPADQLPGAFGSSVGSVLTTGVRGPATALIATGRCGPVGVQVSRSAPDPTGASLAVVSVVADPSVPTHEVAACAADLAPALATGDPSPGTVLDAFDLPMTGHCWQVTAGTARVSGDEDRVAQAMAVLPAWSARSDLDLLPTEGPGFGLEPAIAAIRDRLPPGDWRAQARQSAAASFDRLGFAAAAVSAIGMVRGAPPRRTREVPQRLLTVRFGRPYAVCAVTVGGGPWNGVPVFHAWVARADEAGPDGAAAGGVRAGEEGSQ